MRQSLKDMSLESNIFDEVTWRVSAKWITHRHECMLTGIAKRCGGMCCSSPSFWPPSAYQDGTPLAEAEIVPNGVGMLRKGFSCGHLTPIGCEFATSERPITCLLYPLTLNKAGMLVCHNRITTGHGICKGNFNNGPIIIDAIRANLIALFGEEQVDRVRTQVLAGENSYFNVPQEILRQYEYERELELHNEKIGSRREY